jgi:hypothetical protein
MKDDSMRPAKVLDDWVLHGRRRPSGFGVLDLEAGGVLPGVLGALEPAYVEPAYVEPLYVEPFLSSAL